MGLGGGAPRAKSEPKSERSTISPSSDRDWGTSACVLCSRAPAADVGGEPLTYRSEKIGRSHSITRSIVRPPGWHGISSNSHYGRKASWCGDGASRRVTLLAGLLYLHGATRIGTRRSLVSAIL